MCRWDKGDFLVIFSAGNEGEYGGTDRGRYGSGFYTVKAPGTAKNAISVGAVGTSDSSSRCYPSPCSNDNLYASSSRGPTLDGRVKPDLVAPGERPSDSPQYALRATSDTTLKRELSL